MNLSLACILSRLRFVSLMTDTWRVKRCIIIIIIRMFPTKMSKNAFQSKSILLCTISPTYYFFTQPFLGHEMTQTIANDDPMVLASVSMYVTVLMHSLGGTTTWPLLHYSSHSSLWLFSFTAPVTCGLKDDQNFMKMHWHDNKRPKAFGEGCTEWPRAHCTWHSKRCCRFKPCDRQTSWTSVRIVSISCSLKMKSVG